MQGVDIIHSAMEAPARKIAANAGLRDAEIGHVVQMGRGIIDAGGCFSGPVEDSSYPAGTGSYVPNLGYNAATNRFEDLVASGVIDPAKVVRCALQNAASVAALLLTTEAMVSTIPEKK